MILDMLMNELKVKATPYRKYYHELLATYCQESGAVLSTELA